MGNFCHFVLLLVAPISFVASAIESTPAKGSSLCQIFLAGEVGFNALMPDIGNGILGEFPSSLVRATTRMQFVIASARRPKRSGPSFTETLDKIVAQDQAEGNSKKRLLIGTASHGKSEMIAALINLNRDLATNNPQWRRIKIIVRDIHEFILNFPHNEFEFHDSPIRILPREWQQAMLKRLSKNPPEMLPAGRLAKLMSIAKNTEFSIQGTPPENPKPKSQRNLRFHGTGFMLTGYADIIGDEELSLDPSPTLSYLLKHMRNYYFGNRKVLDENDLRGVYQKHFTFKIEEPTLE